MRRLAWIVAVAVLSLFSAPARAQYMYPASKNEVLTNRMSQRPELRRFDEKVDSFMRYWEIKGATIAVTRNDSLLFAKGYGWADAEARTPMVPGTKMRLASVSKLITAAGIMVLQEKGLLNIQTPVFGPFGVLNEFDPWIKDDNYYLITVEHLLRHQGGFTRRYGDPMFTTTAVMRQFGFSEPPTASELTRKLVGLRLDFIPGSSQYYSNFGYLLLSMIIEKVSGMSYETFIQEEVLRKAGCYDFHLAGNFLSNRLPGESRYYMQRDSEDVPSFTGSGVYGPKCYGGNDIHATLGAGAWVGSAPELARFVASIDGDLRVPDILGFFSLYQMTRRISDDVYPLGWVDCKENGEWLRTGSFSGTQAVVKHFPDGECWVFISNTGTWRGPRFSKNVTGFFNKLRGRFSKLLPEQDLF